MVKITTYLDDETVVEVCGKDAKEAVDSLECVACELAIADESQGESSPFTADEVREFVEGFFVKADASDNSIHIADPDPNNFEAYPIVLQDQDAGEWIAILRDDLTTALCEFLGVTEGE
jgi:hypothetical protein